jgi:formamidopyrimidine-DNA glycosylase
MPELPSIIAYVEAIERLAGGHVLEGVRLGSPFVLRSVEPPLAAVHGKRVLGAHRIGKRVVIDLEDDLHLVIHLMIAGRLRWRERGVRLPGKVGLAAFDFDSGSILFTEQGTKKRAKLHVVQGADGLAEHDPGGLEVLDSDWAGFDARLREHNHTLKRALTDPRIFSGIGNAYSDEILWAAKLSPFKQTQKLDEADSRRLFDAVRSELGAWIVRFREQVGDGFPETVTAFEDAMAVHGKYGQPCPACGAPVQRIRYADNDANYCAECQTAGKLLADRGLSRLLKQDWPKTLDDLEALKARHRG